MVAEKRGKRLVLVGGGHAHVHVVKRFGAHPPPNASLTLVSRDPCTPYSGMLPGVVAGLYRPEQAHIDLTLLSKAAGAQFIHAEAVGIDRDHKQLLLANGAMLSYDILSIDVGITPDLSSISGAREYAIAVKPIGDFLTKFDVLGQASRDPSGPRRIVVIGGGAAGVELILSIHNRLSSQVAPLDGDSFSFSLVTRGEVLRHHNRCVRSTFRRTLASRGIVLHEHRSVAAIRQDHVDLQRGETLKADAVLIATGAAAPPWFANTGLARDSAGFLTVGPTLQISNDPNVFAAGDCATLTRTPRPKAGVFAVRAGPVLARNLGLYARDKPPLAWTPQHDYLALISTGERYAVASRGWLKFEGAWVWRLKDWIDRGWMRQYQVEAPAQ